MRYEYICKNCKKIIEINHSMKEDPEIICDKCKTKMSRKISGGIGFQIKGSLSNKDIYLGNKMEQFQQHPETDPYRKWRNTDD